MVNAQLRSLGCKCLWRPRAMAPREHGQGGVTLGGGRESPPGATGHPDHSLFWFAGRAPLLVGGGWANRRNAFLAEVLDACQPEGPEVGAGVV